MTDNNGYINSVTINSEKFNGRKYNKSIYYDPSPWWNKTFLTMEFLNGCGLSYRSVLSEESSEHTEMVYFNKVDEELGIQIPLTIDDLDIRGLGISLFPNPATSTINIKNINSSSVNIIIYSLAGKVLAKKAITSEEESIDISDLQSGLFIIEFNIENMSHFMKFVKN